MKGDRRDGASSFLACVRVILARSSACVLAVWRGERRILEDGKGVLVGRSDENRAAPEDA